MSDDYKPEFVDPPTLGEIQKRDEEAEEKDLEMIGNILKENQKLRKEIERMKEENKESLDEIFLKELQKTTVNIFNKEFVIREPIPDWFDYKKDGIINRDKFRVQTTVENAEWFRKLPRLENDRDIKANRCKELKHSFKTFRNNFNWEIAYCCEEKMFRRPNGNHTSDLVVKGEVDENGIADVTFYICKTKKDVLRVWGSIDSGIVVRDLKDCINAECASDIEINEIVYTPKKVCTKALAIAHFGATNEKTVSKARKAQLLAQNFDYLKFCYSIFPLEGAIGNKVFWKPGIMYAILVELHNAKGDVEKIEKIRNFYIQTKLGTEDVNSSSRRLRDVILTHDKDRVPQWYSYALYCLHAKELHDENTKIQQLKMVHKKVTDKNGKKVINTLCLNKYIDQTDGQFNCFKENNDKNIKSDTSLHEVVETDTSVKSDESICTIPGYRYKK